MIPPAPIRRPWTVTTWLVLSLLALALSPLLLLAGALATLLTRQPQPLIVARLVISYFAHELGVLVACGALWLASGFGVRMRSPHFQRAHQRLLRWFVHGLSERGLRVLQIETAPEPSPQAAAVLERDGPVLFFSRHAGPGDTILLIDQLMTRYGRLPSVVLKKTLAIDPSVDLIAHRLPHAVLDTANKERCVDRIKEVSRQLSARGVLVLFPEGANFTPERRRSALDKLWRRGRRREARAGEEMAHVLPPHPSGALAALAGNPEAAVVFGAHTGLGLAVFPRELWRHPPIGATLRTRMWLSSPQGSLRDPEEQVKWLYAWWKRLDRWIESRGEEELSEAEAQPGSAP